MTNEQEQIKGESRYGYDREVLVNNTLFRKVQRGWSEYILFNRSCNFDRTGKLLLTSPILRFFEAKFNRSIHEFVSYTANELPELAGGDEKFYLLSWKIYLASCPRPDRIQANNIGFARGDEARIEKIILNFAEEARDAIICREKRYADGETK
jgi:hypothetical protein